MSLGQIELIHLTLDEVSVIYDTRKQRPNERYISNGLDIDISWFGSAWRQVIV